MWKAGDRVVIIQDDRNPLKSFVGFKGTVNFTGGDYINVVFDECVNGHGLGGSCEDGHGWCLFTSGENKAEADRMRVKKINNRKNNYW